jgi:hypothetical protein
MARDMARDEQVRPNVDWNRAHAVEWLVSSVVEQAGRA